MRTADMVGRVFGRLTVISVLERTPKPILLCGCSCGADHIVRGDHLRRGSIKSCGTCYRPSPNLKHGYAGTKEYRAWSKAKSRCHNPDDKQYQDYGARGIRMSDEWRDSFSTFITELGKCPVGLTLERMDNNQGYESGNCRWATSQEQAHNRREAVR